MVLGNGDWAVLKVLVLSALDCDTADAVVLAVKIVLLGGPDIANELTAHSPLEGPGWAETGGSFLVNDTEEIVEMTKEVDSSAEQQRVA